MKEEFSSFITELSPPRRIYVNKLISFLGGDAEDLQSLSEDNQMMVVKFLKFLLSDQELEDLSSVYAAIDVDTKSKPIFFTGK